MGTDASKGRARARELDVDAAGVVTHVLEWGGGGTDATPLVLLHGVLSRGAAWERTAPRLAGAGRRVLAPDMPLHGRTRTPMDLEVGPEGMCSWLEALLDALGVGAADLCGLSMGGAVASHFAARRPARVRRLVLVDAANVVPLAGPYGAFLEEMREALAGALGAGVSATSQCWTEEIGLDGPAAGASGMCADPIISGALMYIESQGVPLAQVLSGLELLRPLGAEGLSAIRASTLAIWGELDPYFPAAGAEAALRGGLHDVHVEVMQGVGHNPVDGRPDEFVRLVTSFLA
jgi:pimeloyl-ACP methyl ester carboxylesterase